MNTTVSDAARAALAYAGNGWPVFPCWPDRKEPAVSHWRDDATTDPEQIRSWWNRNPDFNVAIATGSPGPDVLDVDVKDGGKAWEAFNRLKRAGMLAGAIATVETRSGGLHVYYPGSEQGNAARIGKVPLDFRGKGGYVLAPPSVVEGGRYRLLQHKGGGSQFNLVAARNLLAPPAPVRYIGPGRSPRGRNTASIAKLADWLSGVQEGQGRNNALFWASCRAAEKGWDPEDLVPVAMSIGLTERAARATVQSARNTVAR